MAATELVPCFYTGQNCDVDRPAKMIARGRCRELKTAKIGKFERNGKIFVFSQRIETAMMALFNGPASAKNILVFLKTRTDGAKLHYETPMAGDGNWVDGYTPRRRIHVSSRSLFSNQILPAARIEARA